MSRCRSHGSQDPFAPPQDSIRAADQREELLIEQSRFVSEVSNWRRQIAEAELSEMRRCFERLGPGGATRSVTGRTAGTTSETADRTQTQGSRSNGLMQESGVNTKSGPGSNATGTMGLPEPERPGRAAAPGQASATGR
jgi:hypothetical protein